MAARQRSWSPRPFVYAAWYRVLGLDDGDEGGSESNHRGGKRGDSGDASAGARAGMSYSWALSNHAELSTLDD